MRLPERRGRTAMILGLFNRRPTPAPTAAETAYARIVAQARLPAFYLDFGAPDTAVGRFEMIVLHAFLYFHRLKDEDPAAKATAQEAFDLMFADMDASLREIGIGYQTVPKRIKIMAGAFYSRCQVYDAALAEPGEASLAAALARNVYGDDTESAPGAGRLAIYVRRAAIALAAEPTSALISAGPSFPAAEEPSA